MKLRRSLEARLLGTRAVDSPRADRPVAFAKPPPRTSPVDYLAYELPDPTPAP